MNSGRGIWFAGTHQTTLPLAHRESSPHLNPSLNFVAKTSLAGCVPWIWEECLEFLVHLDGEAGGCFPERLEQGLGDPLDSI